MNIVITSEGNSLDSLFGLRFGRASWFCLYDTNTKETRFIENENKNAAGGAGTKTAELMASLNVKKVVSGDFGPKAKDLLERFNIQMITSQKGESTIQEIISNFQE